MIAPETLSTTASPPREDAADDTATDSVAVCETVATADPTPPAKSASGLRLVMPPSDRVSSARPKPLGRRLVEAGLIHEEQLDSALQRQSQASGNNKRLGEIIAEMGLVDDAQLMPMLGEQLGVPGVRLREGLVDPDAIARLPRQIAESFQVLPLVIVRNELVVAMADPQDLATLDRLSQMTGLGIRPVFTLASHVERLIPRCYEDDFSVDTETADYAEQDLDIQTDAIDLDHSGGASIDGSPVINLVNYAIVQAVSQGASDIHIEPGPRHTSIRFRVDGVLREVMKPRREMHPAIVSRIKVMSKMDIAEHRRPQDGRLHVRIQRRDVDLRVSTLPTVSGEKVVLRILDRRNVTFDLQKLGLPGPSLQSFRQMLARPHGLVLVTGPTGSGKTTTLYSAIELIKSVERNVVTVEDPVEYQLDLINQVQVRAETGMTFATALRSILRQDPDVIMVGEIRDRETAETAIAAALTGHLVLSTLHTNDSASAITRLVDMGVDRFKIAASLVGVIAQRLVRNLCVECREMFYPAASEIEWLTPHLRDGQTIGESFSRPRGCGHCYETGYSGRTGLYELLPASPQLRGMINDESPLEDLRRVGVLSTLAGEGLSLAQRGVTSLDEVARVALAD